MKIVLLFTILLFTLTSKAALITSNGTGGGSFTAGGSWAGGVIPAAGDDVLILAGDVISFNPGTATRTCLSLTLNGTLNFTTNGKTLNVTTFFTTTGNGIVIGTNPARVMNIGTTFTVPAGNSMDIQGVNFTVTGNVTLDGALLATTNNSGTKTFSADLTLNNGSSITCNTAENWNVSGNLFLNGTCTLFDGTATGGVIVTGNASFNAGSVVTIGRGTLNVSGTGNIDGSVLFTSVTGNKQFLGSCNINNNASLTFSVNEDLIVTNVLTFNGTSTINGTTGSVQNSSNTIFAAGCNVTWAGPDFSVAGTTTLAGTLIYSSTTGTSTHTGVVTFNNNGLLQFNGVRTVNMSTHCEMDPVSTIGGGSAVGDLNITGDLNIKTGGTCHVNTVDIDLTGNVNIAGTGVLNASGGGLIIDMLGNWNNMSSAADPFVEGNSIIRLISTTTLQSISHAGAGETFYYLLLNNTSGLSPAVLANNHINISNEYDQTAGILNLAGFDLTITSGATIATTCDFSAGMIMTTVAGSSIDITDGAGDNLYAFFTGTDVGDATHAIALTINTGRIVLQNLELYGVGNFTKTDNIDDVAAGGNIYRNNVTFTTTITASRWRMGDDPAVGDVFYGDASFFANSKGGTNNNFIIGANSIGNEYFGTTTFSSTTLGGFYVGRSNGGLAGTTSGHTFHGPVVIHVADSGNVTLGDAAASNPSNIILESTLQLNSLASSIGDIYVGSASGNSTITMNVAGRIIDGTVLGATTIYLNSITQNTALANNTTNSGASGSAIYVGNGNAANACVFNGTVTLTAPNISLRGSTFNLGPNAFQANSTTLTAFNSYGGNTFNGGTTFTNNGTAAWRLANNATDDFNANVSFTQLSTGALQPVYGADCTFSRNITTGASNAITFGSNGGRVILDGSSNQDINGNSSFTPTWLRGRLLNTSGDVDLNVPLNITTDFDFQDGVLNTTTTNLLIFNAGSTASNATSNSYVDGPCRKVGNTLFAFPVGDNAFYAPLTISAPSNATHHFTAQYFDVDPNTPGFTTSSKVAALDHVSTCEYWNLDRTNGASTVTVTLDYLDTRSCTIPALADLRVARWDGAIWQNHGNGGTPGTTTAGTIITAGAVSAFGPFTLATITAGSDLPVELTEFSVYKEGKEVELEWSTMTETNNDYFSIERSSDLASFTKVGEVDGNGNSNQRMDYGFTDANPLTGISYYRLAQYDFNGKVNYSDVRSINYNGDLAIQVYPNPIENNALTLDINSNEELIGNISIVDLTGKEMLAQKQSILRGNNTFTLELNHLSAGIYFIRVNESIMKFVVK